MVGTASLAVLVASLLLPGPEELSWAAGSRYLVLAAAAGALAWPRRAPSVPMPTLSHAPASTSVGNCPGDVHGTAVQADAIPGPVTVYIPLAPAASPVAGEFCPLTRPIHMHWAPTTPSPALKVKACPLYLYVVRW